MYQRHDVYISLELCQYCDQTTGWMTGVQIPTGAGIFSSSPLYVDWFWGPPYPTGTKGSTHRHPIWLVPRALPTEVKQLEHEANCSPPSSSEVKNTWGYTSSLPIHLHGVWYMVKHRENFTFTFTVNLINLNIWILCSSNIRVTKTHKMSATLHPSSITFSSSYTVK